VDRFDDGSVVLRWYEEGPDVPLGTFVWLGWQFRRDTDVPLDTFGTHPVRNTVGYLSHNVSDVGGTVIWWREGPDPCGAYSLGVFAYRLKSFEAPTAGEEVDRWVVRIADSLRDV
jgi:hypothetical protein